MSEHIGFLRVLLLAAALSPALIPAQTQQPSRAAAATQLAPATPAAADAVTQHVTQATVDTPSQPAGTARPSAPDSTAARDPMAKPARVATTPGAESPAELGTDRKTRLEEIQRTIATLRIEGVALGPSERYAVINDQLLKEGDKVSPQSNVRITKIARQEIVFGYEDETVAYAIIPPQEEAIP